MRAEDLQEVIRATPFRPEWILFQGGRTAVVMEPDQRLHILDVMLVQRLELDPPVPPGPIAPAPDGQEGQP